MRKTREEAELTRQLILDTALKIFNRKGYARTTLEGVAREAGVTRGAIYWHFASKFEMFRAILQALYQRAIKRMTAILSSQHRPLEKLRLLLEDFFLMMENREEFRLLEEVQIFKYDKKLELTELFHGHLENVKMLKDMVTDLMESGIDAGEFKPDLDPEITAVALMSFIGGIKSAWLSGLTDFSLVENAEKMIHIFIYGIANE
jgi:TetR/AcrR family transcriptional regulator, acrAB operon repressor